MPRTLEDFSVGAVFETQEATVTAADIVAFAASFDPQPFHTDPDAAQDSLFGTLVASGWHTAAVTMRLMVDSGADIAGGMIGRRVERIEWPRPTYPGDRLRVRMTVLSVSPNPKTPDRGRIAVESVTVNQTGETVQTMVSTIIVPTRAGVAAAGQRRS